MNRRFLCVCQYGHSRSVAMARALHAAGQDAIACGWQTAGSGLDHLCDWATDILVMDENYRPKILPTQQHKVKVLHVGHDVWANPYHPELYALVCKLAEQHLELKIPN